MPRYYVDTLNGQAIIDDEGVDLPDTRAVHREVHKTLARMMLDEPDGRAAIQFRADVRDEGGRRIFTATLLMVIEAMGSAGPHG